MSQFRSLTGEVGMWYYVAVIVSTFLLLCVVWWEYRRYNRRNDPIDEEHGGVILGFYILPFMVVCLGAFFWFLPEIAPPEFAAAVGLPKPGAEDRAIREEAMRRRQRDRNFEDAKRQAAIRNNVPAGGIDAQYQGLLYDSPDAAVGGLSPFQLDVLRLLQDYDPERAEKIIKRWNLDPATLEKKK
jgi:hypothetical protein